MSLKKLRKLTEKLNEQYENIRTTNTILVVDDSPGDLKSLALILKEVTNHNIILAMTGEDAITMAEESRPIAAIIDLRLPKMNGVEVAEKICELSPGTQCIILTGFADMESAVGAVNSKMAGYLHKPCNVDKLRKILEEIEEEVACRPTMVGASGQDLYSKN